MIEGESCGGIRNGQDEASGATANGVQIRYEGQPRQGMYFIPPDKNCPTRPVQIWSQGESKETRHFVPIYDYPNDMTASETLITVPKTWTTLSTRISYETAAAV